MTEDKVDRAARNKIRTQKREIPEGTEEWGLLHRRYYAEELRKFGGRRLWIAVAAIAA